jgi:hypothetical protein
MLKPGQQNIHPPRFKGFGFHHPHGDEVKVVDLFEDLSAFKKVQGPGLVVK